ncbi:MAG: helix-turn-helix domain-containing protein [Clostridia bacterium]|nr:helix-turn-helix domain-containing protein [Clostridia bacterium]
MNNDIAHRASELYKAVLTLRNEEECAAFFSDICTIQELEALIQRLEVAKSLLDGKNYNDIAKEIGVSTATICRVAKCVKYGDGGYKTVISRVNDEE